MIGASISADHGPAPATPGFEAGALKQQRPATTSGRRPP